MVISIDRTFHDYKLRKLEPKGSVSNVIKGIFENRNHSTVLSRETHIASHLRNESLLILDCTEASIQSQRTGKRNKTHQIGKEDAQLFMDNVIARNLQVS